MKNDIRITACRPGEEAFNHFVEMRNHIYGTHLVQETINYRYLAECVVVYKDNVPSGRLCIYSNELVQHNGRPVLLFGNFEIVNDCEVCNVLMNYVLDYARLAGIGGIIGPVNGSTWEDYRLPLNGEHPEFYGDLVQPLYYKDLLLSTGFEVVYKYYTTLSVVGNTMFPSQDVLAQLSDSGIVIRTIDINNFVTEIRKLYALCTAAFRDNVLYSGISESAFMEKYLPLQDRIQQDFFLLAEKDGQIIAFLFAYPHAKQLVIKTIARHPAHTAKGLVDALVRTLYKNASVAGYNQVIHAFMHEANKSYFRSQLYSAGPLREYGLFIKYA